VLKTTSNDLAETSRIIIQALGSRPSNDDFCSIVVHRLLAKQNARSCFIAVLGNDSNIQASGQYGFEKGLIENVVMNIWKPSGVADAIRTREIQRVNSWEHYHALYPANKVPGLGGEGYLAIPFEGADNTLGAIGITFHDHLSKLELQDDVIELIRLAATFFTQIKGPHQRAAIGKQIDFERLNSTAEVELSEREQNIVQLMARGNTNQEIGLEMHLSESTIRSASVGLFRTLGVHSRKDAVAAAKHLGLIEAIASETTPPPPPAAQVRLTA
jgi:DNA-binding CsgD family transcriptional regulator